MFAVPARRFTSRLPITFALLALCGVLGTRCLAGEAAEPVPAGMVRVEGGVFLMGDLFGDRTHRKWLAETPAHEVVVDSFFLGRFEITVREFREFAEATGYRTSAEKREGAFSQSPEQSHWKRLPFKQTDKEPVLQISWNDAMHYCNWLSQKEGLPKAFNEKTGALLDAEGRETTNVRKVRGYRLPTEAEWEFAARERGRKVRFGNGKDIAKPAEINFDATTAETYSEKGEYRKRSTPVGQFAPNALGLYDMSGNAWEWCLDCASDYTNKMQVNPFVPGDEPRILRGGGWELDAQLIRAAGRTRFGRADHCVNSGFRLARTPMPPAPNPH